MILVLLLLLVSENEDNLFEMSLDELLDMEIVSTSKVAVSSKETPGIVTVWTRAELERFGMDSLSDVLALTPGFSIGRALSILPHDSILVRGTLNLSNQNVLILLDGHRLNDGLTGGAMMFFSDFPISRIERIEVIRGPGSALYGANAFMGVVNIITAKDGDKAVHVAGGSLDHTEAVVNYAYEEGDRLKLNFTVELERTTQDDLEYDGFTSLATDPFLPIPGLNVVWDDPIGYEEKDSLIATFSGQIGNFEFGVDYFENEEISDRPFGSPREPFLFRGELIDPRNKDLFGTIETEALKLRLSYGDDLNEDWSYKVQGGYHDVTNVNDAASLPFRHLFEQPSTYFGSTLFPRDSQTLEVDAGLTWIKDTQSLVFGVSYLQEDSPANVSTTNTPEGVDGIVDEFVPTGDLILETNRDVVALYAQYRRDLSRLWTVTAGIRHDEYSDFGGTTNPRLALVYGGDRITFKALYGRAFRSPSAIEMFNRNRAQIPNPDLQPETNETLEANLSWQPREDLILSGTLFNWSIEDIIETITLENSAQQRVNSGSQEADGVELEAKYLPGGGASFWGNMTYTDSQFTSGGVNRETPGIPTYAFNMGASIDISDFSLTATISRRWDWNAQPAIELQPIPLPNGQARLFLNQGFTPVDHTLVNLIMDYRPTSDWRVRLKAENATDERHVYAASPTFAPTGLPGQGRLISLSARYNY